MFHKELHWDGAIVMIIQLKVKDKLKPLTAVLNSLFVYMTSSVLKLFDLKVGTSSFNLKVVLSFSVLFLLRPMFKDLKPAYSHPS